MPTEYQTLLYLLNMRGNITIADFITTYYYYNGKRKGKEIEQALIIPLLEKGILQIERDTKNKVLEIAKSERN